MKEINLLMEHHKVSKQEFLQKNGDIIKKYVDSLEGEDWKIEGCIGNIDDLNKLTFRGIYVILEKGYVIYIGSALPRKRTIQIRLKEHIGGNHTHTCIIPYLMTSRGLSFKKAQELFKTFDFIAFKYTSLEYLLIDNTSGIINKAGKYINKELR